MELEEAAYMEGCNAYQIFFKVIMPLTKPSFATVGIFSFLWSYNDLFTQTFFLRFPNHWAITRLLSEIFRKAGYGLRSDGCGGFPYCSTVDCSLCLPAEIHYQGYDGGSD